MMRKAIKFCKENFSVKFEIEIFSPRSPISCFDKAKQKLTCSNGSSSFCKEREK